MLKMMSAFAIICVLILAYYYFAFQKLTVSAYQIVVPVQNPMRIVQLSDVHNTEFGKENGELIALVEEQTPDLIFITGDMVNRNDENLEVAKSLITKLSQIAPVYFCYGNHDKDWEENFGPRLHSELSAAGATVLNAEYLDTEVKGNPVRIGGYWGYYGVQAMLSGSDAENRRDIHFVNTFGDTDRYKILLNHIPTQWVDWKYIDHTPVDLVFSGHYHGGAIRIPFLEQGIFAPYVKWFPPHTKGVYTGATTSCVLSTGMGIAHGMPRINNPPELVVVDLVPEK